MLVRILIWQELAISHDVKLYPEVVEEYVRKHRQDHNSEERWRHNISTKINELQLTLHYGPAGKGAHPNASGALCRGGKAMGAAFGMGSSVSKEDPIAANVSLESISTIVRDLHSVLVAGRSVPGSPSFNSRSSTAGCCSTAGGVGSRCSTLSEHSVSRGANSVPAAPLSWASLDAQFTTKQLTERISDMEVSYPRT